MCGNGSSAAFTKGALRPLGLFPKTLLSSEYPIRTTIDAVVILVLTETYCSLMTPWIVLLFLA